MQDDGAAFDAQASIERMRAGLTPAARREMLAAWHADPIHPPDWLIEDGDTDLLRQYQDQALLLE